MFPMPTNMLLTIVGLFSLLPLATAQFQFFDQMFGHGQRQQQQQHPGQWAAQADMVPCNAYLCPTTLSCVANPADCPCHYVEDKKCLIPDADIKGAATIVCVRGASGCEEVERLASRWK